jgi:hypothetical protein
VVVWVGGEIGCVWARNSRRKSRAFMADLGDLGWDWKGSVEGEASYG